MHQNWGEGDNVLKTYPTIQWSLLQLLHDAGHYKKLETFLIGNRLLQVAAD